MQAHDDYRLLDVGEGARLERFGDRIVDRPHPGALGARGDARAWQDANLRYDRDRGWSGEAAASGAWSCQIAGLTLELRPTEAGQVGLFPEHVAMLPWLSQRLAAGRAGANSNEEPPPAVLNLFAYTGLATLALAAAGATVTHVDSSRPTVTWARLNAALSNLADRRIRWIVDDTVRFTSREVRRGRRYTGLVLDPPSYGHGLAGEAWRIEADLANLLSDAISLLEPGGFVLLTAHSPGFDADRLASMLAALLGQRPGNVDRGDLAVSTDDGRRLELGAFARWAAGAS